jgi:hypothetical protein
MLARRSAPNAPVMLLGCPSKKTLLMTFALPASPANILFRKDSTGLTFVA